MMYSRSLFISTRRKCEYTIYWILGKKSQFPLGFENIKCPILYSTMCSFYCTSVSFHFKVKSEPGGKENYRFGVKKKDLSLLLDIWRRHSLGTSLYNGGSSSHVKPGHLIPNETLHIKWLIFPLQLGKLRHRVTWSNKQNGLMTLWRLYFLTNLPSKVCGKASIVYLEQWRSKLSFNFSPLRKEENKVLLRSTKNIRTWKVCSGFIFVFINKRASDLVHDKKLSTHGMKLKSLQDEKRCAFMVQYLDGHSKIMKCTVVDCGRKSLMSITTY